MTVYQFSDQTTLETARDQLKAADSDLTTVALAAGSSRYLRLLSTPNTAAAAIAADLTEVVLPEAFAEVPQIKWPEFWAKFQDSDAGEYLFENTTWAIQLSALQARFVALVSGRSEFVDSADEPLLIHWNKVRYGNTDKGHDPVVFGSAETDPLNAWASEFNLPIYWTATGILKLKN